MRMECRSDETKGEWRDTATQPADLVGITGCSETEIRDALECGEIVRSICCEYRKAGKPAGGAER